ncbi:MAG: flagellin hook IN motif-containing protein [Candidatus Krumholzibacteria bacterium]|nr:flagellin hook IN motif-containing protein [Candidatus Krumholzibacteria bacterium]
MSRNTSVGRATPAAGSADQRQQLLFARDKISDLQKALHIIDKNLPKVGRSSQKSAATTQSASDLGLGIPTAAYLESTAEVNATGTSFETHGPGWEGTSTAVALIDGEYDGSNGSGTMTFYVDKAGSRESNDLKIKVLDPAGDKIETIHILRNDDLDTIYTLSNGLELTLGAGDLIKDDIFTLDVSTTTGSIANPDQAFNATGTADANLEYGLDVGPGTFEVNGTTINVAADDSINSVLAKINGSAAGVTATYSMSTELVTLVHDTPGVAGSISLQNDTSGFLATTKLAGATLVAGIEDQRDSLLKDLDRFVATTAGDVFINGTAIAIDPDADSLQDVIDRINASESGAQASIDATGRYFTLTAENTTDQLVVDDNGRGFFPALAVASGTSAPANSVSNDSDKKNRQRAHRISAAMRDISKAVNSLFGTGVPGDEVGNWLQLVRTNMTNDFTSLMNGNGKSDLARIGLKFDLNANTGRVFRFSGQDEVTLNSAVSKRSNAVRDLFLNERSSREVGFLEALQATAEVNLGAIDRALGFTGSNVDSYA